MAPPALHPATRRWMTAAGSASTTSAVLLSRRDLTVNDAQKVTLGIIAAYVVAIALLWNLPYIRWVLWPFKVTSPPSLFPKPPFLHSHHLIPNDLPPSPANSRVGIRCS